MSGKIQRQPLRDPSKVASKQTMSQRASVAGEKAQKRLTSLVRLLSNTASGLITGTSYLGKETLNTISKKMVKTTYKKATSQNASLDVIKQHKDSKISQLKVESQNLRLALETIDDLKSRYASSSLTKAPSQEETKEPNDNFSQSISQDGTTKNDMINQIVNAFETNANIEINVLFHKETMTNFELNETTKSLRNSALDPKAFLKQTGFIQKEASFTGKLFKKDHPLDIALKTTRGKALDKIGANTVGKSEQKFEKTISSTTINTTIEQRSETFVSSESNRTNYETCGNLHKQTVTNNNGVSSFRSAAITVKKTQQDSLTVKGSNETVSFLAEQFIKEGNINDSLCQEWGFDMASIPKNPGGDDQFKTELTRKVGLRNKAIDLISNAAQDANNDSPLNLTSLSLMTPDRPRAIGGGDNKISGGEIEKLSDQRDAFQLIRTMSDKSKIDAGIKNKNGDAKEVQIMDFNFGVNEGESMGRMFQASRNKEAMTQLVQLTNDHISDNETELQTLEKDSQEYKALAAKIDVQKELLHTIESDFDEFNDFQSLEGAMKGKGAWKADKAYDLTAKIAVLTSLNGDQNHCNCASGKDRTGMHMALTLSYSNKIMAQIELKSNTPSHTLDLRTSNEIINQAQNTKKLTPFKNHNDLDQLIQSEQAINLAIMTESGQKEIQRKNTGSEGYKLESNVMANWLTGGGQTESYFSKLTGLSTEEVANQIVADAKYNKT